MHDARRFLGLPGRIDAQHVAAFRKITLAEQVSREKAGEELSEEGDYHDGGAKGKFLGTRPRIVEWIFNQWIDAESFLTA